MRITSAKPTRKTAAIFILCGVFMWLSHGGPITKCNFYLSRKSEKLTQMHLLQHWLLVISKTCYVEILKITSDMIKGVKLCGLKLWVDYSTVTQFKPPLHGADRSCNYNYTLWSKQPLFYQLLKCDVRSAFLCERCSNIQLRCRRVDVFQIKV